MHHLIAFLQYNQEVIVVIGEPNKSFEYLSAEAADPHICQQIDKRWWDYLWGNDLVSAVKYLSMCFLKAAEAMQVVLFQGRSVLAPHDPLDSGRNSHQLVEEARGNNGKISTRSRNQGTGTEKYNFSGKESTKKLKIYWLQPILQRSLS